MQESLESKPVHHTDTSVIMESDKTIDGRACVKYMQKVGYNYYGKFSLPMLGELMMSFFLIKDSEKRHTFLDILTTRKAANKIDIYTPFDIHEIAKRIREIDMRLEPTDIEIIACAIEDGANNLITLDKNLVGNKSIEREFKLRIVHPRDLL